MTSAWVSGLYLAVLAILGVATWSEGGTPTHDAEGVAIVGLVLAAVVLRPQGFRQDAKPLPPALWMPAVVLYVLGVFSGLLFPRALGWTLLAGALLQSRVRYDETVPLLRLLPVAVLSFPWIATDLSGLSWSFRVTGAGFASSCFEFAGLDVVRQGMSFSVEGFPVEVSPDCSGMVALQSIMMIGSIMALRLFPRSLHFWIVLLALPGLAWLVNSLRIMTLTVLGLSTDVVVASGGAHDVVGWVITLILYAGFVLGARLLSQLCLPSSPSNP